MRFNPHVGSSRRWLAAICILFAALMLTAQAMHVHPDAGLSSSTCPICVSAHTSAPVAAITTQMLLVAIASIVIAGELQTPSAESILPLFIRPPPQA
jgi:hypothetical protein